MRTVVDDIARLDGSGPVSFQSSRREQGRPLVDDPWRAVKELVIGANGLVRLAYAYQHCEDFPNPKVLSVAARLS